MRCTNRLLWQTNSDFYGIQTPTFAPYKPFFWGVGVVFNIFTGSGHDLRHQGGPIQRCDSEDFLLLFAKETQTKARCQYWGVAPANQTKESAKTKSSWISPIFSWILVFFPRKTSTIHIELLFRNAPAESSWTDLSLVWFAGATPEILPCQKVTSAYWVWNGAFEHATMGH